MATQTPRSRWWVWALLALGAVVAAYLAVPGLSDWVTDRLAGRPEAVTAPEPPVVEAPPVPAPIPAASGTRIGERAPDFTLPSLGGASVSLSQFRGRIVILDFWASWCAPCRATMPSLHSLWREVASHGVELVGVSLDRTAAAATAYLGANDFTDMLALWGSYAAAQAVATQYRVTGIPHTFIIDRAGVVRFNNHPARLDRALLESLL